MAESGGAGEQGDADGTIELGYPVCERLRRDAERRRSGSAVA